MRKGIKFEVATTDVEQAIEVLEVAFGYEGEEWEKAKNAKNMEELIKFLEEDGLDFQIFNLKN